MTMSFALTDGQFATSVLAARHGERFPYFRGHLQQAVQDQYLRPKVRESVARLAADVRASVHAGHGVVVQKRHGEDDYEYLFERTVPERDR